MVTGGPEPSSLVRRYVKVSLSLTCPRCGHAERLGAVADGWTCPACGRAQALPALFWRRVVDEAEEHYPDLAWNRGLEREETVAGARVGFVFGRKWPRCAHCDGPLPSELSDASDPLRVPCLQCGHALEGAPPPAWLQAVAPSVAYVIGPSGEKGATASASYLRFEGRSPRMARMEAEKQEADKQEAEAARTPTVARPCPRCGSALVGPKGACAQCGRPANARSRALIAVLLGLIVLVPLGLLAYRISQRWDFIAHSARYYADSLLEDRPPRGLSPPAGVVTAVAAQRLLRWRLSRPEQRGMPNASQDPCVLSAQATRPAGRPLELAVSVRCAERVVYAADTRDARAGLTCHLQELPTVITAHYEYDLQCQTEPAAGRLSLALDTVTGDLRLDGDRGAYFLARIERGDGTGVGPALFMDPGATAAFDPIRIPATRTAYEGDMALPGGEACQVQIGPSGKVDMPCRVRIRCGQQTLYGGFAQGFCPCQVRDGRVIAARDDEVTSQDGDPALQLSIVEGFARLHNDLPEYVVELHLPH